MLWGIVDSGALTISFLASFLPSLFIGRRRQDAEATHSDTFSGFSFIESSIPLPRHEPAYKQKLRQARAARKAQGHADPDLFDGLDAPPAGTAASARKRNKKKKAPQALPPQQQLEAGAGAVGGVTGAGASGGSAAAVEGLVDGDTTKPRSTSIAESGVEGAEEEEDGVDKTLRLLQAAAAAGAAARKQQQQAAEAAEEEREGGRGVSALAADFPPLEAAGETQAVPSSPSPALAAPSCLPGKLLPEPPTPPTDALQSSWVTQASAEPVLRRERAPTPPIKQEQQQEPSAPAAPKPAAFSWSAVVAKHATAPASAPASPFKSPAPLQAAFASASSSPTKPPSSSSAAAAAAGVEANAEEDGFVVVTAKRGGGGKPRLPGAQPAAVTPAASTTLNGGAKAFVPRGSSWASRV